MLFDKYGNEATYGARSLCPSCDGALIAKCGRIISNHWAHVAAECDPWSEPESQWHLAWKRWYRDERGADVEVVKGRHRADVVLPTGKVVELQSTYLSVNDIVERESFYGDMVWLYRCHWRDRLQFGRRGFWWKHGSKAMAAHRRPVWWDMGDELWRVELAVKGSWYGTFEGQPMFSSLYRVVGRIVGDRPRPVQAAA